MNVPAASLQKIENNLKDMWPNFPSSNNPSMSLVEWMATGGDSMNIVHNYQSNNLNEHSITFNFSTEDSESVQDDLEDDPRFFEDDILEENQVDNIFSAEFMQENKINRDTFLYSSELFF